MSPAAIARTATAAGLDAVALREALLAHRTPPVLRPESPRSDS